MPEKRFAVNRRRCQKNGLLLIGAGHNVIRFVPPLVISKADVDEAVSVFEKVLMKINK